MSKKKQNIFKVLTKPKSKPIPTVKTPDLTLVKAETSGKRTPEQVLTLLKQLEAHIKTGGSIQDFCFKVGISPRQMREHRAKYRVNPKMFAGKLK